MKMEHAMTDLGNASNDSGEKLPGKRRDVRRLAMQVLYQIDVTGETDRQALLEGVDTQFDKQAVREQGVDLALGAWAQHDQADARVAGLAPEWPTHRQPPVDRAILRLAYYEITAGVTPMKVAINEAIELAKQYASESSPAFVNGVLDKLAKTVGPRDGRAEQTPAEAGPADEKAWLDDAEETSP
jgi:transcription antitermination protein NusB